MHIAKINDTGLLSFSIEQGFYLQDLSTDYDIGKALHIKTSDDEERKYEGIIYLGRESYLQVPLPAQILEAFGSISDPMSIALWQKGNLSILNVAWGRTPISDEEKINSFLHFFCWGTALSFRGEYGVELCCFLPFIQFLFSCGALVDRRVITYYGMDAHYSFLEAGQIEFRSDLIRRDNYQEFYRFPSVQLCGYTSKESSLEQYYPASKVLHALTNKGRELRSLFITDLPKIIILNKFCVEWAMGPINYIPLMILEKIFSKYNTVVEFIYSRPGLQDDIAQDNDVSCNYPDLALVRRHNVKVFEFHTDRFNYNLNKFWTYNSADMFMCTQGGGSMFLPQFGKPILLLHKKGPEDWPQLNTYGSTGFYHYASPTKASLVVAKTDEQYLEQSFNAIEEILKRSRFLV